MVQISWNSETCHSSKAHNFYKSFIADESVYVLFGLISPEMILSKRSDGI